MSIMLTIKVMEEERRGLPLSVAVMFSLMPVWFEMMPLWVRDAKSNDDANLQKERKV